MNSDLEAQVIDVEERLRQAMLNNDVAVLDELIAPDLLFTGHLGQLASKADDLAAHRARLLRAERIEPSERHIQLHPNFAVVSVLMHLIGSYAGEPIDQYMRYTRVWAIGANGSLPIVAGHMSEVKAIS
ncbi:MAG: nuclear transport factor 2 family protein [Anaerolineae bacterium]|nr:nuclear transport factor 2 family protein [Anaerolineae bacterium]